MKTEDMFLNRKFNPHSRCKGSVLLTFLVFSFLGSFIALQTLLLYQKQRSAVRELRKTFAKKQAFLFADHIFRQLKQKKPAFFVAEATKQIHSYTVHTQLMDSGTNDFTQTFLSDDSDPLTNASIHVTVLPKLAETFVSGESFTLETLRKQLKECTLISPLPLLNVDQQEAVFERWKFLQTSTGALELPLFMPIITSITTKNCTLWNPYDRPLRGTLQFKCIAEVSDEKGNIFIEPNIKFDLIISLSPGSSRTLLFEEYIAFLERILHVKITNCPKFYQICEWDIPKECRYGWPFCITKRFSRRPNNNTEQDRKIPSGIIFNTQTQLQQLDACLLFHCDEIYHTIGQREHIFISDAQSSKEIPWNIFLQNPPCDSLPLYFFGTDEELFAMYPSDSDKEKFWEFFSKKDKNNEQNEDNTTSSVRPLEVLQANIDTLLIFSFFETKREFCLCEMEVKHTKNGDWKMQTTRYRYKQKPKNFQKSVPSQAQTTEQSVLSSINDPLDDEQTHAEDADSTDADEDSENEETDILMPPPAITIPKEEIKHPASPDTRDEATNENPPF